MSSCKCLLVGDGGTGKTSLVKRLLTGKFSTSYSATSGYEIQHLTVHTKDFSTKLVFNIWDVSGQTSSGNLLREILSGAHCAIIVFEVTSRITFNNVAIWYREILHACGSDIPIVIVGNKIDMPSRKIKTEAMVRKFPSDIKYYDISVKTKFNIEQPLLWIAAQLLQNSQTNLKDKSKFALENLRVLGKESPDVCKADYEKGVLVPLLKKPVADSSETTSERQGRLRTAGRLNKSSDNGILKDQNGKKKKVDDKQSRRKINKVVTN